MDRSANFTFKWEAGPQNVIITGNFDDWSGTLPLLKTPSGNFEITMPVSFVPEFDYKFYFKYIVDGDWTVNDKYKKENDGSGFENNYIDMYDIPTSSDKEIRIPEGGGLPVYTTAVGQRTEQSSRLPADTQKVMSSSSDNNDLHILPIEEPVTRNSLNSAPGPVIVRNPNDIKEFKEISNVDANRLNERLNKQLMDKKKIESTGEISAFELSDPSADDKKRNVKDSELSEVKMKSEKNSKEIFDKNYSEPTKKESSNQKSSKENKKGKNAIFGKLKKLFK